MNSLAWIGIILWGIIVTGFGLMGAEAPAGGGDMAAQDVIFLVAGGILTCLIGFTGLMGFMGWIPGLQRGAKARLTRA